MNQHTNLVPDPAFVRADSVLHASLCELTRIYADLENHTARFALRAGLSCPEGCGTCCSNFEPDITDVESAYLALHLLTAAPFLIERLTRVALQHSCAFYEPGGIYHCSVYAVRPLVCRAFGFSASTGKDGRPSFAGCKLMPGVRAVALSSGGAASEAPLMAEYGVRVSALSAGMRSAMRAGVLRAVNSLGLKKQLFSPPATETPSPDSDFPSPEKPRRSGAA